MDTQVLTKALKNLCADVFGITEDTISDNTNFIYDLNASSLDFTDLLMNIESTYNIKLDIYKFDKVNTFSQLVNLVEESINNHE